MAKITLTMDKRQKTACGYPLVISIYHKTVTRYISSGVTIPESDWDGSAIICRNELLSRLAIQLQKLVLTAQLEMINRPELNLLSCPDLVREIKGVLFPDRATRTNKRNCVLPVMRKYAANLSAGTQSLYKQTERKITLYLGTKAESLCFEDITKGWLMDFETFLARTASKNARNIHLRNLRTICNFARDEEITTNYPFKNFSIIAEKTKKRSLSIEQLCNLWTCDVEPYQQIYLDLFKLTFMLMGINLIDLLNLRHGDLVGDRLTYRRKKTGHLFEGVLVIPEAREIIDRYRGKILLLDILEKRNDYQTFRSKTARALGRIGDVERVGRGGKKIITPYFPGLSLYWARHTWATIASYLDIPKEVIRAGLGHAETEVTDIYINFDFEKVNRANRKIIDFVLNEINHSVSS